MRISTKFSGLIIVASGLVVSGCPKSKTDSSNARTDVTQITVNTPSANSTPAAEKETKVTTPKPVVKDPVPAEKSTVDTHAGVTKKPEKTKKGENLAVSSTHVEVVSPTNPNVTVVIETAPAATQPAVDEQRTTPPELVEFPAVKLPGSNETVAVGETAAAILADPQPIQAAAVVAEEESGSAPVVATPVSYEASTQTAAEETVKTVEVSVKAEEPVKAEETVKAEESAKTPEVVSASVAAQLETDLGQQIPVADVKEVELTPNTEYKVTFVEETKTVDIAMVVTLAAEPKIKSAEQQDDGTVKLEIDANGNPGDTLYSIAIVMPATGEILGYVDASTGDILKEGQERFHPLKNPTPVVKSLAEDVELVTFVIQAQNQKGEATSWSEETAIVPVAEDVLKVDDNTEVAADDTSTVDPASMGIDIATATEKDVEVKIDAGQAGLTSLKDQLKELKAKLDSVRKELKARNNDRREIQKKLKKLEKDSKKHAKEIDKLKSELEGAQLKIDSLGKQLRDIKAQIKALQGKVKDQAAEIKKLKKVLAQIKKAAKKSGSKKKK